jgi:DNA-binding IscR family transcriptional regulator
MKPSNQLSDAIHILAYIKIFENTTELSSERIAQSVETNATNVRKIMSQLRNAQLIVTTTGRPAPKLTRSIDDITLFDVYRAIAGSALILQIDQKTNPNCVVGANIQTALDKAYQQVQTAAMKEMQSITLATIIHDLSQAEIEQRSENRALVAPYLN